MIGLCLAALLAGTVHAQVLPPRALLTTQQAYFGTEGPFIFDVTLASDTGFDVQNLEFFPEDTFTVSCAPRFDDLDSDSCRQYRCNARVSDDVTTSRKVMVALVTDDEHSNRLITYMVAPPSAPMLYSDPEMFDGTVSAPEGKVSFFWSHPDGVLLNEVVPLQVERRDLLSDDLWTAVPIVHLSHSEEFSTAAVEVENGAEYRAMVVAGATTDLLGQWSEESNLWQATVDGALIIDPNPCPRTPWSVWSECSCLTYDRFFEVVPSTRTRVREVIAGDDSSDSSDCEDLIDIELCEPTCLGQSRPYSAETGFECSADETGVVQDNFAASGCFASNPDEVFPYKEPSGCECRSGCEELGTCCVAWYDRRCCEGGDCYELYPDQIFNGRAHVCTRSDCDSEDAIRRPNDSYWCYCDVGCVERGDCCQGTESRNNICSN